MIMWSYYIVDIGALRDDLDEIHQVIMNQRWWTSPEVAQSMAETDILERITATVLDPKCIPEKIEWEAEAEEDDTTAGFCKKTYRWGGEDYGFFVTIYSRRIWSS